MSQHPFGWPYGRAPPTQPRAHQAASHHQTAPYGAPYNRGPAEHNFAASQGAFQYNSSRIPGLGGSPTVGTNTYRTPPGINSPWQHAPFAPAPGPSQTRQATQPTKPSAVLPSQSAFKTVVQVSNEDVEEGELSEGQFEDLYEPKLPQPSKPATKTATKPAQAQLTNPPPTTRDDPEESVVDSPGADLYDNEEEGEIVGDQKDHGARERTGSYSPYLSPHEIQSRVNTPRQATIDAGQNSNETKTTVNFAAKAVPGLGQLVHAGSGSPAAVSHTQGRTLNSTKGPPSPAEPEQKPTFQSVQEAKKEAQKAILKLLHLGVKYQDYIDEGIDEKTIQRYFSELKLDASQLKAAPASPLQKALQPTGRVLDTSRKTTAEKSATEMTQADVMADKSEERKDRIARLLKQKKTAKPAASASATPQPAGDAAQPTTNPDSSGKPGKVWGEKERLIQQKLRDLQKSRDAGGQQATSDEPSASPQLSQAPRETPSAPIPSKIQSKPEAQAASNSKTQMPPSMTKSPSVAGTPSHLARQQTQNNQRKRPVAADFVDYPSAAASVKRPFGQSRQNSSYIIDVTDESESGEMDMDVESLPDTSTIQRPGMLIRDFPPLSGASNEGKFSSPATSAQNLAKQSALELKEKAIQEMKRKIAEAEAKTQAKRSTRSTPPAPQVQTFQQARQASDPARPSPVLPLRRAISSDADGPSAQLFAEAKASMKDPKPLSPTKPLPDKAGRRTRIVSAELPRIDSDLDLKRTRLKQLQEEQARLQAEVEQCLEAKRKLDAELQDIDAMPVEDVRNGHGTDDHGDVGERGVAAEVEAEVEAAPENGAQTPAGVTEDVPMDEGDSPVEAAEFVNASKTDVNGSVAHDSPEDEAPAQSRQNGEQQTEQTEADQVGESEAAENTHVQTPAIDDMGSAVQETQDTPMDVAESVEGDAPMDDAISEDDAISDASEPRGAGIDSPADLEADALPDADANVPAGQERVSEHSTPASEQAQTTMANRAAAAASEPLTNGTMTSRTTAAFRPYESPLRYFRAYRFHPKYRETVQGGLKSLTYSHKIRADDVLCPRELAGEECPGDCEFQHFGSMAIPDNMIISELGKHDHFVGEQRDAFIEGLREVVAKVRAEKVKDFDTIARRIIEYRVRFLGDETKVLALGDVNP